MLGPRHAAHSPRLNSLGERPGGDGGGLGAPDGVGGASAAAPASALEAALAEHCVKYSLRGSPRSRAGSHSPSAGRRSRSPLTGGPVRAAVAAASPPQSPGGQGYQRQQQQP